MRRAWVPHTRAVMCSLIIAALTAHPTPHYHTLHATHTREKTRGRHTPDRLRASKQGSTSGQEDNTTAGGGKASRRDPRQSASFAPSSCSSTTRLDRFCARCQSPLGGDGLGPVTTESPFSMPAPPASPPSRTPAQHEAGGSTAASGGTVAPSGGSESLSPSASSHRSNSSSGNNGGGHHASRQHFSSNGGYFPASDAQTYRDLLIFEERLKQNAARLIKRKKKYQSAQRPVGSECNQ